MDANEREKIKQKYNTETVNGVEIMNVPASIFFELLDRAQTAEKALKEARAELSARIAFEQNIQGQLQEAEELIRKACTFENEDGHPVKYGEFDEVDPVGNYILPKELPNIPALENNLKNVQSELKKARTALQHKSDYLNIAQANFEREENENGQLRDEREELKKEIEQLREEMEKAQGWFEGELDEGRFAQKEVERLQKEFGVLRTTLGGTVAALTPQSDSGGE